MKTLGTASARLALLALAPALLVSTLAGEASAIERGEVMARARAFAMHPWRVAPTNLDATCNGAYQSVYVPGDFVGLPYDWGGYMTLFQFDQRIDDGQGAGSYPEDGILDCTAGLDCSGFVSQAWQVGHFTTSSLHETSAAIDVDAMLAGDVFNEAGYHVAMLVDILASGAPRLVEAIGYNVHYGSPGWGHVDGFIPRRHGGITGSSDAEPVGTPHEPIVVPSFPYQDDRNTAQSKSDLLDGCGVAPGTDESGREFVYEVTFDAPGQLTATITDDAGVDIDVHVYSSNNTSDCFARHDSTVTVNVDCGTYLVVADTFRGSNGESPGAYAIAMSFVPSGAQCGDGPEGYAPEGELGDPCGYPGDPELPFCNSNLGAETCLYGDDASFCSKPCAGAGDCAALPGGCCADIGDGELYCLAADFCEGPPPDEGSGGAPGGGTETGTGAGVTTAAGPGATSGTGAGAGATTASGPAAGAGGAAGDGGATGDGSDDDDDGTSSSGDSAEDAGGCATAPAPAGKGAGWVAALALTGIAARRRRRG